MEKDCQLFANVMVNKIQKFQFNYYRVPTLLKDSDLSKKETDFSHFLQIRSKFYVGTVRPHSTLSLCPRKT